MYLCMKLVGVRACVRACVNFKLFSNTVDTFPTFRYGLWNTD